MEYAKRLLAVQGQLLALDIGGGAARNALPLAKLGIRVVLTDLSQPMLDAAHTRLGTEGERAPVQLVLAPMAPLPFRDSSFDLVVAHGIWNLANTGDEFRRAVAEAARVARRGAHLFLFTFSRHTIPVTDQPVTGESFVFTQFNGEPQCFLSEDEIIYELGRAGFEKESAAPLTEYNNQGAPRLKAQGPPVLYEGCFVRP
jgi:ubiquinone/menaquinone biosynthesis C-methylase UbiE